MTRSVTVYCSSSNRVSEEFFKAASELGKTLAEKQIGLVFGGGNVGLMGCIANAVMENGGNVRGIIPRFLEEKEVGHYGITELHVVETMHERKIKLTEWADAFIVLPGGFGTLDELIEVITWRHLGHHNKPILLFNVNGFWNPLTDFFDNLASQHMVKPDHHRLYTICNSIEEILVSL
ncbi:MAG: TIGR00730 family Rossman fold protein [Prosthecochloris sp.]|uniref:LOG family protein n=1 Tax=Prosthecochloris sp. TaxID=290513 RepID=UPI0013C803E6|nr:TIGR00730 family Rossman fold protein [Prosthecochloris sp.]NEX11747.1 TIGR00730 family Rossman fold protein [Prosthecochloris sp.]